MWCPSATLSVWTNAWLAGRTAPDDVLDALTHWAPRQSVAAFDPVAAGSTGLPWPAGYNAGSMSLLQTVRAAAAGATTPTIGVILPVPGDVRGLPAGTEFERDALSAGEAVIVADSDDPHAAVGLIPAFDGAAPDQAALSWTVYALPEVPVLDRCDLGEAEYALRSAVRSAAEALTTLGLGKSGAADPRALVEQLLETTRAHRIPYHAPSRALRVLENAAHVDAIITVSTQMAPVGTQSSSQVQLAAEALGRLAEVVRSARMAAVTAIVQSAWGS
jgi:hypothetical protein